MGEGGGGKGGVEREGGEGGAIYCRMILLDLAENVLSG